MYLFYEYNTFFCLFLATSFTLSSVSFLLIKPLSFMSSLGRKGHSAKEIERLIDWANELDKSEGFNGFYKGSKFGAKIQLIRKDFPAEEAKLLFIYL